MEQVLAAYRCQRIFGLNVYLDAPEHLQEIRNGSTRRKRGHLSPLDHLAFPYNQAAVCFAQATDSDSPRIPFDQHLFSSIIITPSRKTFLGWYHTPSRASMLPPWVVMFVNSRIGSVVLHAPDTISQALSRVPQSSLAHEYTHLLLPLKLGLPAEYLEEILPPWIREGIPVAIHQLKKINWWQFPGTYQGGFRMIPSLNSIEEKGIFAHDTRPPEENTAFQYAALVTREFALRLNPQSNNLFPPPIFNDLMRLILRHSQLAEIRKGEMPTVSLTDFALRKYGVSIQECEAHVRHITGLGELNF